MSAPPTFGRYAEIPVDQMTAEQKEGYRFLVEGPNSSLRAEIMDCVCRALPRLPAPMERFFLAAAYS